MISVSITSDKIKQIMQAFKQMPEETTRAVMRATQRAGIFGVGEVKYVMSTGINMFRPPVLTGALRRGIHLAEKEPMKAVIRYSDTTPYGYFVHEGTSRMEARPFFDITAKESGEKISEFYQIEIDNMIKRLIK